MTIYTLQLLAIIAGIVLLAILVNKLDNKFKPFLGIALLLGSLIAGYFLYDSIQAPIKFNKVKEERYSDVVKKMMDIKASQLAYKTVKGKYSNNWSELVSFIENEKFAITQRRDTTVLDVEKTEAFKVDYYKEITITDTLSFKSVKDSLFKTSDRYKKMMFVPHTESKKFELKAGDLEEEEFKIPVFEVKYPKSEILADQDPYYLSLENDPENVSIEDINGTHITLGSMTSVNTNGNWPKKYELN